MKNNKFAKVISLITFFLLAFFYEWYVKAWAINEISAIIRVDIFIIYPVILILTFVTFFLFKKVRTTKNKLFSTILFILFWIMFAGMFKFNILANMKGYDVDGNLIELEHTNFEIKKKQLIGSWLDTSESKLHFTLFKDGTARSDNMETLLYRKWRMEGNNLILTEESVGNGNTSIGDYEYEIVLLNDKALSLKNGKSIERYVKKGNQ
ncbi:MAG: hypothetical protein IMY72_01890 [Bacteroidetes bacterium]|nr:hypothetical protein [Bacteroidota bacterium]